MSKMFMRRFVASILGLLIASSVFLTNGQSQNGILSDEDEVQILESLIQSDIKALDSQFGKRVFSSENIGSVSATRIAKHGFSLMSAREIERLKQEYVVDYVVIRSISLRNGIVVVRLSTVTEGRGCFASFSGELSFTYWYKKNPTGWVGWLVKRPEPFPFTRRLAATP
jgi:hypothetical protein